MEEAKKETSSAAGDEDMHFTTNGNGRSLTIGTFNRIGERVSPQKVSVPSRDTSQTGHLRMKDERHTLKYPASAEMSTVSLRWTAEQVLNNFRHQFISYMDANAIVHSLVYERIIANSDLTNITSNPDLRQRNEILHACLLRTCNEKALMKVCEIIVEQGYPTMKELGENMKSMLEEGPAPKQPTTQLQPACQPSQPTPRLLPPQPLQYTSQSLQTGSHPTPPNPDQGSDATQIGQDIGHEIKVKYMDIKRIFVEVCTKLKSPTLPEIKDLCFDLLEGVFRNIPRRSRREDDIQQAKTLEELMRIVCFRLSNFVSYDFFRRVNAKFQPALKEVADKLAFYENELKPLLLQKLRHIAELRQRKDAPQNMDEFIDKYRLNADGLLVEELAAARDFLEQRLHIPHDLLETLSFD